jgi:hypothetical protein
MSLQATVQIIGAIGVIVSFFYVGLQIRNNARATRAATYQQLSASFATSWDALFFNGDAVEFILRAGRDMASLSEDEKVRYYFFMMATMRRFENAWFQRQLGILTEPDWKSIAFDLETIFAYPGARDAWAVVKNRNTAKFQTFVDGVVARLVDGG